MHTYIQHIPNHIYFIIIVYLLIIDCSGYDFENLIHAYFNFIITVLIYLKLNSNVV